MMQARLVGLLSLLASFAFSAPASSREYSAAGSGGDAYDVDMCETIKGERMVGVRFRSGGWIDQITIACAIPDADGKLSDRTYPRPARGGGGGGEDEIYCPKNNVVTGMHFRMTKENRQVRHVQFYCTPTTANPFDVRKTYSQIYLGPEDSPNYGTLNPYQPCDPGDAAVGVKINHGRHVNALGLICMKFSLPKAKGAVAVPAPPPSKVPAESTAPLGSAADYAGKWATTTQKIAFDLTLNVNGNDVTGEFEAKADPARAGTLAGTISPNNGVLRYSWSQPQINMSGTGTFKVHTDDTIYGGTTHKPPGAAKGIFHRWHGTRISRGVVGTGGGQTATVVNDVTVYQQPDGKEICFTKKGDTGKLLQKKDDEDRWLLLAGISGDCGGRNGWVWQGDNKEDVSLK